MFFYFKQINLSLIYKKFLTENKDFVFLRATSELVGSQNLLLDKFIQINVWAFSF